MCPLQMFVLGTGRLGPCWRASAPSLRSPASCLVATRRAAQLCMRSTARRCVGLRLGGVAWAADRRLRPGVCLRTCLHATGALSLHARRRACGSRARSSWACRALASSPSARRIARRCARRSTPRPCATARRSSAWMRRRARASRLSSMAGRAVVERAAASACVRGTACGHLSVPHFSLAPARGRVSYSLARSCGRVSCRACLRVGSVSVRPPVL